MNLENLKTNVLDAIQFASSKMKDLNVKLETIITNVEGKIKEKAGRKGVIAARVVAVAAAVGIFVLVAVKFPIILIPAGIIAIGVAYYKRTEIRAFIQNAIQQIRKPPKNEGASSVLKTSIGNLKPKETPKDAANN